MTGVEREHLGTLVAAELDRLQRTLDSDVVEPITEFSLADALKPVLLAHRLCGATLHAELAPVRALGRPRATATAVANLLANARVHAPGAAVQVCAVRRGTRVVLTVDDDGPGIPPGDRARVLRPWVRGPGPGAGSGLGLYTAAVAMAGQSGSLQLADRAGGGTRVVLTLPAPALALLGEAS